jgi:hypothetical protein
VYVETPVALHGAARRSLRAHLTKLQDEGRAQRDTEGAWTAI